MVLNGDIKLFHLTLNCMKFKQTMQTLILRRVLWCLISDLSLHCLVMSQSGFYRSSFLTALSRHSDKTKAARNNRYLDLVQTRGLISLVNDNYVDNNLKEILMYVYFGSIVST